MSSETFISLLKRTEKANVGREVPFHEILKAAYESYNATEKSNDTASFRIAVDNKFKSRRILNFILGSPAGVSKTAIVRKFNSLEPALIDSVLYELAKENAIESVRVIPEGKGRPTTLYKELKQ